MVTKRQNLAFTQSPLNPARRNTTVDKWIVEKLI